MKLAAKDKRIESDMESLRWQRISITKLRANLDSAKHERQAFEGNFRQCKGQLSKVTEFSQQPAADEAHECKVSILKADAFLSLITLKQPQTVTGLVASMLGNDKAMC